MEIVRTVAETKALFDKYRSQGKSIGFSPTMGALHQGHASLISKSQSKDDISVCSIFVNPTQFNEKSDLEKYPRTLEADIKILEDIGCDVLFAPSVKDVYPSDFHHEAISLGGLDQTMEGAKRPGHFDGVVEVVKRLLDIVVPDHIYMGQKDFQQFSIIDYMLRHYKMKTKLVVCPILREDDGLAMSSRNVRLEPHIRTRASVLYKTLTCTQDWLKFIPIDFVMDKALNALSIVDFKPEYFEIVDGYTLKRIRDYRNSDYVVACTAVWAGDVRLIDNMIYKK